ncbi:MAG: hypothetical protein KUG80_09265 [Gammaproteobacteria bacterium]|nr:hypothetical protein [Gammaproteobacteria bacterium]
MNKVNFKIRHCYGIPHLDHEFDFSNNNMPVVLYAPNGLMKTSLAKSINDYIRGVAPTDKVFPDRDSIFEVKDENGGEVLPESIFVIDSINEKYKSERMSTLLASEDLKLQYDEIFRDIGLKRDVVLKKLKQLSGLSKDIDKVFSKDFGLPEGDFLLALARLEREVKSEKHQGYDNFKYKNIFSDKVLAFISDPDFSNLIEEYTGVYEKIIDESKYFKKGIFNHSNAETIAKNLKANGWFEGGHSVMLNDGSVGVEISTEDELETAIDQEKEAILNDETLKDMFSKVDKALSNAELKAFREYLIENPSLVSELSDVGYLKTKIWIGYLTKINDHYFDLVQTYDESEEKLKVIISKAEAEQTHWESVIETFNKRFSVPFSIRVENKGDAVLNLDSPQIVFYFNDESDEPTKKIDRNLLDSILSNGEKRALYILNIIFEVEARQKSQIETLFVIDDIADSFDYKNKYAIIEYLWGMKNIPSFHLLIMTHNFDFYRTVKGRLSVYGENKLLASRAGNVISVAKDELGDSPFSFWKSNLDQIEYFLASIPFVRNLAEYTGNSNAYNVLTALLHIKPTSQEITVSDINSIFSEILSDGSADIALNTEQPIFGVISSTCDLILDNPDDGILLEQKVVLSIGIRLKAEEILIDLIQDQEYVNGIQKNQTSKLIRKYSKMDTCNQDVLALMHQVSLMTPENIHINSFMFEPILDMSIHHLKSLYRELGSLD